MKFLMNAYGTPLTAFARRMVRNHDLAEDVRQNVFLEALQGLDRFEGRSSLWTWLCGIAHHRCLDEQRRLRRVSASEERDFLDGLAGPPDTAIEADRVVKRRALEQCLGHLSDSLRSQLLMRCFLGLSYAEIGEVVGVRHSTVQMRMSRILPRLRQCLRQEGVTR